MQRKNSLNIWRIKSIISEESKAEFIKYLTKAEFIKYLSKAEFIKYLEDNA